MRSFEEARRTVITQVLARGTARATLTLPIGEALGYISAEKIRTDREYPPFDRSTRDGYAARASEATPGARLRCVGEIKAGDSVTEALPVGSCVQIMTGAAVPSGADAVVMIEFTRREGERVTFERTTQTGQNIVARGSEARAGEVALSAGIRLGFAELAVVVRLQPVPPGPRI